MVSKELLSEVLDDYSISGEGIEYGEDNEIQYPFNTPCGTKYEYINIYYLANRCKQWAWEQSCSIQTRYIPYQIVCQIIDAKLEDGFLKYIDEAPSEPEAVFKACQWIFDNK